MYKIVIIDDNELTRRSIAKTIKRRLPDCSVVGDASDGREGLSCIQSVCPDIIISDIKMPDLDGLSMVRMVQSALPATQIIFITGYQDFENAHAAIRLHACAFLLKPIHDSQLLEAIALAMDEIQKNAPSMIQGFQELGLLLQQNATEAFEEKLSSIYRKAIYLVQKAPDDSSDILLNCMRQVCSIILHYFWNLAPQKINLDQETTDLYHFTQVPDSEAEWSAFLMGYSNRLRLFAVREQQNYSLIITHVLQYLESHYQQDLSLSEVAKVVSVNPSYLSSLIKKETGKNFIDIIIEARLEHAKKLLQNPCHRINEVADLSGFKDYAYFYQTFKKHVGLSPKEYRNQFL